MKKISDNFMIKRHTYIIIIIIIIIITFSFARRNQIQNLINRYDASIQLTNQRRKYIIDINNIFNVSYINMLLHGYSRHEDNIHNLFLSNDYISEIKNIGVYLQGFKDSVYNVNVITDYQKFFITNLLNDISDVFYNRYIPNIEKFYYAVYINDNHQIQNIMLEMIDINIQIRQMLDDLQEFNFTLMEYIESRIEELNLDEFFYLGIDVFLMFLIVSILFVFAYIIEKNSLLHKKLTSEKINFIASISHELRTPVNSILNYTDLLLTEKNLTENAQKNIIRTAKNANFLKNIVEELLDMGQIESGYLRLKESYFKLETVIDIVFSNVYNLAKNKGLELVINMPNIPYENMEFFGDILLLKKVCINLIANGIKFTHKGSITLNIKKIYKDNEKCELQFEVVDTGVGITKENMKKLFLPYAKGESAEDLQSQKEYGGSTGLGLFLSKGWVEKMGSTINVESTVGVGSVFYFSVKFGYIEVQNSQYKEKSGIKSIDTVKPFYKNTNILIVDDSDFSRDVVTQQLENIGIKIYTCINGKQAIETVKERIDKQFDIIFMDINMPIMDGLAASREIKKIVKTPIITMSADVPNIDKFKEAKVSDYITKPFISDDLYRICLKYIDKSKQVDNENNKENAKIENFYKVFYKEYENVINNIQNNLKNGDFESSYLMCHNLKSSAGYLKFNGLHEIAKKLEQSYKNKDIDEDSFEKLKIELTSILESIKTKYEIENKLENIQLTEEEQISLIDELKKLLAKNDVKAIDIAKQLLNIENISQDTRNIISEIEDFNFEQALKILEEKRY